MKEICVVVDMINGFINEGPLSDPSINQIVPKTIEVIESFLKDKKDVLAFQDAHTDDALEFMNYPPHCLKGTSESDLIPELKVYEKNMLQIEKNTTNGFFAPGFQDYLKANPDLDSVTVVGCCTDICVLQFVETLKTFSQTINKDIEVKVVKDAVDTFGMEGHEKEVFNSTSLKLMQSCGAILI